MINIPVTEKRTQIYLTSAQHEALRRVAHARGTSLAGVVREAVDAYLRKPPAGAKRERVGPDPLADLIGFVEAGRDLSERHDDVLYGPKRRRR
jgi:hypothetical protein